MKEQSENTRIFACKMGVFFLKLFCITCVMATLFFIIAAIKVLPEKWKWYCACLLGCILIEALIFWIGMITVYVSSIQLGIRYRVLGIVCGMIPIVHLIVLGIIIKTVSNEIKYETKKKKIDEARKEQRICQTKYPILFVHGVFFRDFKYLNYWGRIPDEIKKNGAEVYYGKQQSAASVMECGEELKEQIRSIIKKTNCEKVNLIAHSKGGLDCRAALLDEDIEKKVASLTTINTPHKGCEFADYLLTKISEPIQKRVATTYNSALKKLGDKNPDFIEAVTDLTASKCKAFNELTRKKETEYQKEIFCQSVGSKLNHATNGRFPLNFTYPLVKYFDGENDGLVSKESFSWGEAFQMLYTKGNRGISHADMIDLNRENLNDFDVREFYVQLVADLKKRGL